MSVFPLLMCSLAAFAPADQLGYPEGKDSLVLDITADHSVIEIPAVYKDSLVLDITADPFVIEIPTVYDDSLCLLIEQSSRFYLRYLTGKSDSVTSALLRSQETTSWTRYEERPCALDWSGDDATPLLDGVFIRGLRLDLDVSGTLGDYRTIKREVTEIFAVNFEGNGATSSSIMHRAEELKPFYADTIYSGIVELQTITYANADLKTLQSLILLGSASSSVFGEVVGDSTWQKECVLSQTTSIQFNLPESILRSLGTNTLADIPSSISIPPALPMIYPNIPSAPELLMLAVDTVKTYSFGQVAVFSDTLINGAYYEEGLLAYIPFGSISGPFTFGQDPTFGQWAWAAVDALCIALLPVSSASRAMSRVYRIAEQTIIRVDDIPGLERLPLELLDAKAIGTSQRLLQSGVNCADDMAELDRLLDDAVRSIDGRYIRLFDTTEFVARSSDDIARQIRSTISAARESLHDRACTAMKRSLEALGETGFDRTHHIAELFRRDAAAVRTRNILASAGIAIETDPRCGIRLCTQFHDVLTYSKRGVQVQYTEWVNRLLENARPNQIPDILAYIKNTLADANLSTYRTGRVPQSFFDEIGAAAPSL
jgi:hypothetical protein